MGVLRGINKVALRYQAAPNVHLGPCHDLDPLWLFLSTPEQIARLDLRFPEATTLLTPLPPTHLLYTTHVILQKLFKKLFFTKPVILTSCQLCSYNVSYNTSLLLWHGYNQAPDKWYFLKYQMCDLEQFSKIQSHNYSEPSVVCKNNIHSSWWVLWPTKSLCNHYLHVYVATVAAVGNKTTFM